MTAAVLALAVAVFTVIAYEVLADRFDYASVRRRQLDLVAAVMAFACFGAIVFGAVETRVRQVGRPLPAETWTPEPAHDAPAEAGERPALGLAPAATAVAKVSVRLLDPPPGDPVPAVEPAAAAEPAPVDEPEGDEPSGRGSDRAVAGSLPTAPAVEPGAEAGGGPPAAPTVVLRVPSPTSVAGLPTATAARVVVTRLPPVPATPSPAPVQPTSPPPTREPLPLPSATPHCGEPSAGRLTLSDLGAEADRDGDDLVVRFRATIRNTAAYPLTLSDGSAIALNQTAGSEQYGHARLSDITIEPGALVTLDGTVNLTKLPPPFGRTELCLSMAVDSCGLRAERPVRQCTVVRGF
jgi:hypothetical protein